MNDRNRAIFFEFFAEIGMIAHLHREMLEVRMPLSLNIHHFSVINLLASRGDGRTPLELARAFQTPKASMTHTLGGLQQHGLIDFMPHPDDRRSKLTLLTAKGREFRDQAIANLDPDIAPLLERLSMERLGAMLPELRLVHRALDEARDKC